MTFDRTPALLALLNNTVLPTHEPNASKLPPDGAVNAHRQIVHAYIQLYGGSPIPQARPLNGASRTHLRTWQAVVVSNGPTACRDMAERVKAAVDNVFIDGARAQVPLVTGPIEDRDLQTDWRWSSTVDIEIRD